jgi:hypothetical protein
VDHPSQPVVLAVSPLNRTLLVGGMFSVAGDCLGTIAEFLSDIGRAHALHHQRQLALAEFAQDVSREIDRLTDS